MNRVMAHGFDQVRQLPPEGSDESRGLLSSLLPAHHHSDGIKRIPGLKSGWP